VVPASNKKPTVNDALNYEVSRKRSVEELQSDPPINSVFSATVLLK
jgi:hypothetical protein